MLTQPAITQQIKALEDEFGVPLFDRGGGHIALTAGGKALLPFAEKMKELSDEAFAAVGEAFWTTCGRTRYGSIADDWPIPPANVRSWISKNKS